MRRAFHLADAPRRLTAKQAAALGLSAAIVAGAVALAVTEERAGRPGPAPAPVRTLPVDPLAAEFARCQALGEAGAHDAGCLAAWAENRRRFLAPDRRPMAANPPARKEP
jgi:conjugative transfer region protein TrbK